VKYKLIVVGALETNCYLVSCENILECAIVDPGGDAKKIFASITEESLKPVVILNTHGHIDHIGANRDMKEKYDIPLRIHASDSIMLGNSHQSELSFFLQTKSSPPADSFFAEGDQIPIGNSYLSVLHTPGHSSGSVSFIGNGFFISGDSLFCAGVGRTDLPGGSWDELVTSIKTKIFTLPEETVVLPGHGPSTTVGQEKRSNPFIR